MDQDLLMNSKPSIQSYRINISVNGDPQGFRFEVMHTALNSGINGYIQRKGMNEFKIAAEGEEENIEKFITWLENGFHFTKIETGMLVEGEIENFTSFDIRKSIKVNGKIASPGKEKKNSSLYKKFRRLLIKRTKVG
jgi:acylphosphatase